MDLHPQVVRLYLLQSEHFKDSLVLVPSKNQMLLAVSNSKFLRVPKIIALLSTNLSSSRRNLSPDSVV